MLFPKSVNEHICSRFMLFFPLLYLTVTMDLFFCFYELSSVLIKTNLTKDKDSLAMTVTKLTRDLAKVRFLLVFRCFMFDFVL